jgi:hypothetical protein
MANPSEGLPCGSAHPVYGEDVLRRIFVPVAVDGPLAMTDEKEFVAYVIPKVPGGIIDGKPTQVSPGEAALRVLREAGVVVNGDLDEATRRAILLGELPAASAVGVSLNVVEGPPDERDRPLAAPE